MAYISFQPSDYFNTLLYSGNGTTNTAQTGVGFQPDWTWIKERSSTSSHLITDAVRGANKSLSSNLSGAESTETQSLISFDSDGFTVGSGGAVNESSQTYVAWNWLANGSGSSNTDGSVTSTVSANTTSGFSIVKWTSSGNTQVGHGLGVSPNFIIMKSISGDANWIVGSDALGWSNRIKLNDTSASGSSGAFQSTDPTSSIFYENYSATSYDKIAYCFAEKKGFSKFGSYTGNGSSTDNAFVYTGFKPAFLLIKRYDTTEGWQIFDNKRDPDNVVEARLEADSSGAENTTVDWMDLCSNGFKIRYNGGGVGTSGGTYAYMAFAEHPLVSSNDIPATAR